MKIINLKIIVKIIATTLKTSCYLLCLSFFRKCFRDVANKSINNWAKNLLNIAKVDYSIYNSYQVNISPNRPYIIMSNHRSHYDIPLIFATFPNVTVRMMAKKELFNVPIWGHAMKQCEFFVLDRNNAKSAQHSLKLAQEKMRTGVIPWIAPEGTRSTDNKLQKFKKGGFLLALETEAIIVPVFINGSEKILPAKQLVFQTNQKIDIHIGKPIDTQNLCIKDLRQIMENIKTQWEQIKSL